MRRCLAFPFLATVALSLCARAVDAQDLVTLEGIIPSAGEFTIHGPNACGYPNPDHFVWFMPDYGWPCGSLAPFLPPPTGITGDVALDKIRDVVWGTDGVQLSAYSAGVVITSVSVAPGTLLTGTITGLGFDSENDRLWLTDGTDAVAIAPPSGACPMLGAPVVGPIGLPLGGTQALDIDWDSWTDSLWITDTAGTVLNVTTTGAIGPKGFFNPTSCGFPGNGPLPGIAFDSATGTLWVTDGLAMVNLTTSGAAAPPTFYAPSGPCCTPPPPGPPSRMAGLAFSPRPLAYGSGCATVGSVPSIGFTGSFSTSPNPAFGITLSGAQPNSPAALLIGVGAPCPGLAWGPCEVLVTPIVFVFTANTDASGNAAKALPIPAFAPATAPIGTTVMAQWLVLPGVGRQTTEGLEFTLSTP